MKIIVTPNAFKGSLTTRQAAAAITAGIHRAYPQAEVIQIPVADGGDGLVEVTREVFNGETRMKKVTGPDFAPVTAEYCFVPERRMAAVEMALASGLALLAPSMLDPTRTTTFGTGELIRAALDAGANHILVGIGGSATNDGGIGAAAALGIKFLDEEGKEIRPTGGTLNQIRHIDHTGRDPRIDTACIDVACDVDNPLTGDKGAARIFGPQKGAGPEQIELLEEGLQHLAECIRRDLGLDVLQLAGGGAAGGLGAGLFAFLGGRLQKGIGLILDLVGLDQKMNGADLVITGEGRIDFQTTYGKAPAGVAAVAHEKKIPCIALAGSIGGDISDLHQHGLNAIFSLCNGPISLEQAMKNSDHLLAFASEQAVRCFFSR